MKLENKTIVVTGAASGIGLAMVTRFIAEGANIVAGDWNEQTLNSAVDNLSAKGGNIVGLQGNIAERETADNLIDLAIDTYGGIDVLCNNAGVADYMQGVAETEDDIWRKVMSINVDGVMYASRKAVAHMLSHGGGAIINTASVAGLRGGIAGAAYTTAKHAIIGLTRNTAWMYAKKGIRCNAICPGAITTNIVDTMPEDRIDSAGIQRTSEVMALCPGYLESSDISDLALFLASDESRMINGAAITADAGWISS